VETVERCELCGDAKFSPFIRGRDRGHGLEGEFQLVKCINCGLIFINPRPDTEEIKRFYPAAYGPHAETSGPTHGHRLSPLRRHIYSLFYNYPHDNQGKGILLKILLLPVKWAVARNTIPFQGEGKILDIGAGSGSFLASMKALGWDPYGVDIFSEAVERAKSLGVKMFQGEVQEASFPERFFDVITLRAVLEHVHHPVETLQEVHRILKDKGIVYGLAWKFPVISMPIRRVLYGIWPRRQGLKFCPRGFARVLWASGEASSIGMMTERVSKKTGPSYRAKRSVLLEGSGERPQICFISEIRWNTS